MLFFVCKFSDCLIDAPQVAKDYVMHEGLPLFWERHLLRRVHALRSCRGGFYRDGERAVEDNALAPHIMMGSALTAAFTLRYLHAQQLQQQQQEQVEAAAAAAGQQ